MTTQTIAGPHDHLQAHIRWRWSEIGFWLATLLPFVLTPNYLVLASQIAITALFALSLDLILGFCGIISLGHAAYFGVGSYTAGLLSQWGWGEPLFGILAAAVAAGLFGYLTSFVIAQFRHLALIMITLGIGLVLQEAANSASWLTGGSDGLQGIHSWPIFGWFHFDLYGYTAYSYSLVVLFVIFLARRGGLFIPRSGWRCAASARMDSVCRPSVRRRTHISAPSTRSPPSLRELPAPFWQRPPKPSRWRF